MSLRTVRALTTLALALTAAAPATSQINLQLFARTDLVNNFTSRKIAAGTDVTPGFGFDGSAFGRCARVATFRGVVTPAVMPSVEVSERLQQGQCNGTLTIGISDLTLIASAPTRATGTLRLEASADWHSGLAFDLGLDGVYELARQGELFQVEHEYPVELYPSGLPILIRVGARGTSHSWASFTLTTTFIQGPGKLERLGGSCGPILSARYVDSTEPRFEFDVQQSPVTGLAWFAFGLSALKLPISTNCRLLVDPLIPLPAVVDTSGRARLDVPVPPNFGAVDMRVQFVAATPLPVAFDYFSSEVFRVRLP